MNTAASYPREMQLGEQILYLNVKINPFIAHSKSVLELLSYWWRIWREMLNTLLQDEVLVNRKKYPISENHMAVIWQQKNKTVFCIALKKSAPSTAADQTSQL